MARGDDRRVAPPPRRQVFQAYDVDRTRHPGGVHFCPRCGNPCAQVQRGRLPRPWCRKCQYVHYRNPAPGVAVVLTEDRRVLLGRRVPTAAYGGKWAFPAGFIEFNEDFLTAAQREAKEETGLDIAVTGIVNVTSNYLSESLHAVVIAVAAQPVGGTLAPGDDLCEVRWVPLRGPFPSLAYEADAELLGLLASEALPCLPVDPRYAIAQPDRGEHS